MWFTRCGSYVTCCDLLLFWPTVFRSPPAFLASSLTLLHSISWNHQGSGCLNVLDTVESEKSISNSFTVHSKVWLRTNIWKWICISFYLIFWHQIPTADFTSMRFFEANIGCTKSSAAFFACIRSFNTNFWIHNDSTLPNQWLRVNE